jgi:polysaccharide pyruvyl transferase WcaK-like protein
MSSNPVHPLRVGFYGVLGSGNTGNDASLDVVIKFLRDRHPEAHVGFFAMGPDRLSACYGAPSTPLQWYEAHADSLSWLPASLLKVTGRLLDPVRTLRWVRGFDAVIVPGMGVLETTVPTRPWGPPYNMFWLSLTARLAGTRVALVSVGAEAGANGLTRWLFSSAARMAHYRSYRDTRSRDEMRKMGVDVSRDQVYPDLVFGLDRSTPPRAPTPGLVGVGLMNFRGRTEDRANAREVHEAYVASVTRFIAWLLDCGRQVRLLIGDKEDMVVRDTVQAGLRAMSHDGLESVQAPPITNLDELLEAMSDVEAVVATRYHNVLGALKLAIPTLSISYARKNDVLMAQMGLGEYCQPAREVDVDRLIEQFRSLSAHRESLAVHLRECDRANRQGVARQLEALSAFLLASAA